MPIAYLTPDELPDGYECKGLLLPVGWAWQSFILDALLRLGEAYNWEQVDGVAPESAAAVWQESISAFDRGDCPMFAGMVVCSARSTLPSDRWLFCDGEEYASEDYPALYAAIGTAFGSSGEGLFCVPDLACRAVVGVGSADGLTTRALADEGGEESHQLIESELATHYHDIPGVLGSGGSELGFLFVFDGSTAWPVSGGAAGSNTAHNTMPPFLALNFLIYAG